MPWDPFLMKILLKKEICGFVNSAWDPLKKLKSWNRFSKKKKKRWNAGCRRYPNINLVCIWIHVCGRHLRFMFFFLCGEKHFSGVVFSFQWVPCTVHGTHKPFYFVIFSLKMGFTILFTHLKIILLLCFQFSTK